MKQFLTVVKFELATMLRKKSFLISVVVVALLSAAIFSIPRFRSLFEDRAQEGEKSGELVVYDAQNIFSKKTILEQVFPEYTIVFAKDRGELEAAVKQQDAEKGFEILGPLSYVYYVENSSKYDVTTARFEEALKQQYQHSQLEREGYDVDKVMTILHAQVESDTKILGTDASSNYWYTYALLLLLYMMILLYGNQIGVSVASEKSNRAIEILITSCSSNALIFGKVVAGAIAGILQTALFIGSVLLAYQLNVDVWDHSLDAFLNIPPSVLLIFITFGIFGYLLFSFLFGAVGAMCDKLEEVNAATVPVQMIIVVCFLLCAVCLQMPDSLLSTIVAYVPFTSWMCMFMKAAMGSAQLLEIAISFLLLFVTTILTGLLGARLYRRGTLSYGNGIKLKNMLQMMRKKED